VPASDAGSSEVATSALERQRVQQQAQLLNAACDLEPRIRALLQATCAAYNGYCDDAAGVADGAQAGCHADAAQLAVVALAPLIADLLRGLLEMTEPQVGRTRSRHRVTRFSPAAPRPRSQCSLPLAASRCLARFQFVRLLPMLYPQLVALMSTDDRAVRALVHDIFEARTDVFVGNATR
jgi:hypothetical protein